MRNILRSLRPSVLMLGLALLAAPSILVAADDTREFGGPMLVPPSLPETKPAPPPATAPLPAPPPAATAPNVAGGTVPATQTSDSTLQELLHPAPIGTPRVPLSASPLVVPAAPGVAPDQQPVVRLREGQNVWNRVGRLVKDEKTGQWMFAFDADGKEMKDPPVGLLPCRMLMAMEKASEDGAKSVRFRISGEVTEYHGKNYMIVRYMQTVRDLNQF